jgi:hypothetical protein
MKGLEGLTTVGSPGASALRPLEQDGPKEKD